MEPISYTVQLTIADFRYYNLYHSKKSLLFGLIFYMLIFILTSSIISGANFLIVKLVLGAILTIIITGLLLVLIIFRSKRIFQNDKLIQHEQHHTVDAEKLYFTTKSSTGVIQWSDVYKFKEYKHLFAVYLSNNKAIIVPKRCLTEDQINKFRSFYKK